MTTVNDMMKTLDKLKAPRANLGYLYTIEALQLIYQDLSWSRKITALYRQIGIRYGTTQSRVERAIRYEVECIFQNADKSELENVFGDYRKNGKLSNKEFLISLSFYLTYRGAN